MKVNTTQGALERLKAQRDADYLSPWEPGKPRTDSELIWEYIVKLQDRISLAQDELFLHTYRDDMNR
ncbi:MAG: hypothetical protein EOO61_06990 [Hymenobacter sp.]|nr:MAG: hypothetical protein EOO61_06990 [Hymenobacter sp.]